VNAATGWIEVRGEPLQGGEHTGWITPRFLAGQPHGGEPLPDTLAWCPPQGSPALHPSGQLRLATWNPENLHKRSSGSHRKWMNPTTGQATTVPD
jgi:hypothetical protein